MRPQTEGALTRRRGTVVSTAVLWTLLLNKGVLAHGVGAACPQKQVVLAPGPGICPLAVNENSPTRHWQGTWAYPPYCVFENRQVSPGEQKIRYCLYTNTFFGEYGISILAQPEAAANATSLVLGAYHFALPSPERVQKWNAKPAIRVVDMPEKGGKGVVAMRHIKRAETFMIDYAAIVGDLNIWGSISEREGRPLLDLAAQQLACPDLVLELSRGAGGPGVEGVIKTNTFRTFMNGVPQKTLFPRIARINHSCQPNSMIKFSSTGPVAGISAFRDISPGEEITISYIPVTDTSQARKQQLQDWGFVCSCPLCSASPTQVATSDSRREQLSKGVYLMVEALQRGAVAEAVSILRKALQSLEAEGLEPLSGEVYEGLARIHWAVGDKATARQLAARAVGYRADFGPVLEPTDRRADLEAMIAGFE